MKNCTKCKVQKSLSDFSIRNKTKNTFNPWCKECFREHQANTYKTNPITKEKLIQTKKNLVHRNYQFIWDYFKIHHCKDCGESDPRVLEFDHIEQSSKIGNISELVRSAYSLKKLKEEIAKCNVLCANCHRRKTYIQFNWKTYT